MAQTTQSFSTFTVKGSTGQTVQRSGPYRCNTTPVVTVFYKKGNKFGTAPKLGSNAGQFATWTLLRPTS